MEWIDVKDRLPEIDSDYKSSPDCLVCGRSDYTGDIITTLGWLRENMLWEFIYEEKGNKVNVTHWMPLPKPPEK